MSKNKFTSAPIFRQPLWWWLGRTNDDLDELFGRSVSHQSRGLKRLGLIWRRFNNVRPNPIIRAREIWTRGRNGWAIQDTWSLDHYLLGWLPDALAKIKEHPGYPLGLCDCPDDDWNHTNCNGYERWCEIIDKMIVGLEAGRRILADECYERPQEEWQACHEALEAEFREGWNLMGRHFFSLWT